MYKDKKYESCNNSTTIPGGYVGWRYVQGWEGRVLLVAAARTAGTVGEDARLAAVVPLLRHTLKQNKNSKKVLNQKSIYYYF